MRVLKTAGKILGILLLLIVVAVVGYVAYMQIQYYRIEDNLVIFTETNREEQLGTDSSYTIMTYNIGFGAYSEDYTFFMDTGEMKDGTKTVGKSSRAESKEEACSNTEGSIGLLKEEDPDFLFIQEADEKATRSYQLNQVEMLKEAFSGYGSAYACNFHSAYLFYPILEPHGSVKAGMLTLGKYRIEESIRRQAAANYIQSGHYREAMNVLQSLQQKNGQWYYLSAMANMGLGNNVNALNDIKEAVRLEPDNVQYRMLQQQMEGGGTWYQEMQNPFGGMPTGGDDYCMKLCLANLACSLCCPGGGVFCC